MSSSEDYLDSLLANALQKNTEPEEDTVIPESDKMSPEEISALFDMLDAEKEEPAYDLDAMLDKVIAESAEASHEDTHIEKTLISEAVWDDESDDEAEVPKDFQKVVEENVTLEELTRRFEPEPETEDSVAEESVLPVIEAEESVLPVIEAEESKADNSAPISQDEIASLMAQLEEEDEEEEDDIEAKLAAAKQLGEQQAEEADEMLSETDDLLKLLDSFGEEDESAADIGDMLKKSDEKKLVDKSVAEVPAMAEVAAAWADEGENAEEKQQEKPAKKKKSLKEFFSFGKKKKEKGTDAETDTEASAKNDFDSAFSLDEESRTESDFNENNVAENSAEKSDIRESGNEKNDDFAALGDADAFADFNSLFAEMATESDEAPLAEQLGLTGDSADAADVAEDKAALTDTSTGAGSGENPSAASDANAENPAKKEKKPGFFQRLFHALTEEVQEDEDAVPEKKATKLSDENLNILSELDAEGELEEKKGKKKKEKKEKEKKKKKKPEKPKKVKVLSDDKEDGKKIPRKHIINTFALSFSILFAIILITLYVPALVNLQDAREEFYRGNYMDAYLSMYGKDLNESDRLLYEKARLIVILERKLESYENYSAMNMRADALDVLLQGLARYEDLKEEGDELDVLPQMNEVREQMLEALDSDFNISEEEAMAIIAYSPLDYSDKIRSVIEGTDFVPRAQVIADEYGIGYGERGLEIGGGSEAGSEAPAEGQGDEDALDGSDLDMPDLLPEEEAYLNGEIPEE